VKDYYNIPFNTQALIDRKRHTKCELSESIRMNIHLIIRTHYKEFRYDSTYGCMIWNKDYSTVTNVSHWKDELKEHMLKSIEINETRINKVKIDLNMEDTEISEKLKKQPQKLKKRITIQIKGVIKLINEPFMHYEQLFFSPLSIG